MDTTPTEPDPLAVLAAWESYERARTAAARRFDTVQRILQSTRDSMLAAPLPSDLTTEAERDAARAVRYHFAHAVYCGGMGQAHTAYLDAVDVPWSAYWELVNAPTRPDPLTDRPPLLAKRLHSVPDTDGSTPA